MTALSLNGGWTVSAIGDTPVSCVDVPAQLPGCVHLDLMSAGLIPDPFDGDNESLLEWIGRTSWVYDRTFDWVPDGEDVQQLMISGLDTVATVSLNGATLALTENQFRTYRFDVSQKLLAGENRIVISIEAPLVAVEARAEKHGNWPHVEKHPYNALRKMACDFGWDWGIDAPTVGVMGEIGIESWSRVRIDSVRPLAYVFEGDGVLDVHVDLENWGEPESALVVASISKDGKQIDEAGAEVKGDGVIELRVEDPELWWPVGYGLPETYDVSVELRAGSGDGRTWAHDIGFKTVEIDTSSDVEGETCKLIVNGQLINVRGYDWIPDDAFLPRTTPKRIDDLLDLAVEGGANLLRIWGGGIYETDVFYEACTKRGLMVWQDFLLACAFYSEEPWLAGEIEAEARENIARLSKHASLTTWCGNNENLINYSEWGNREELNGRPWGDGYYTEMFPELLAELDDTRPYTPGSPFSPVPYVSPNSDVSGTVHLWEVWNEKDYRCYREVKPRFVSEFGFQGPAAWTTLFDVVHDVPADPYGKQMLVHQKAADGNLKLQRGYEGHFPEPRTIDDWHLTTQLNQAAAVRFGVEYFRSLFPYNNGAIIWQLNDNWPVVSWAAVDYELRKKPLWYAVRDAYAPKFATFQKTGDEVELVTLNDTAKAYNGSVLLRRMDFEGTVLAETSIPIEIPTHGAVKVSVAPDLAVPGDSASEILVATFDGDGPTRAILNFEEVVSQVLDPEALSVEIIEGDKGATIRLIATSYVRDALILPDRANPSADVDKNLLTLLPGEIVDVNIVCNEAVTAKQLLAPEVVRSANSLLGEPVGTPLS